MIQHESVKPSYSSPLYFIYQNIKKNGTAKFKWKNLVVPFESVYWYMITCCLRAIITVSQEVRRAFIYQNIKRNGTRNSVYKKNEQIISPLVFDVSHSVFRILLLRCRTIPVRHHSQKAKVPLSDYNLHWGILSFHCHKPLAYSDSKAYSAIHIQDW